MRKSKRKLALDSETVKPLSIGELDQVGGGEDAVPNAETRCTYRNSGCNIIHETCRCK